MLAAARLMNVDTATSWLVGDRARDIEAARSAGLAGAIHLIGQAANPSRTVQQAVTSDSFQVLSAATPLEALETLKEVGLLGGRR